VVAVTLSPRLPDAYYNRGMTYEGLARTDDAIQQYLLALEIDPAFAPARDRLTHIAGR